MYMPLALGTFLRDKLQNIHDSKDLAQFVSSIANESFISQEKDTCVIMLLVCAVVIVAVIWIVDPGCEKGE